jgi:ABC-type sugar transport system ATPase subunit
MGEVIRNMEPILKASGIMKAFDNFYALNDVDFSVSRQGQRANRRKRRRENQRL